MAQAHVFEASRIDKISKIMPNFSKVAQVGDQVLMGLEGDPAFPYSYGNRPYGTVVEVYDVHGEPTLTLECSDGSRKSVNSYTISPTDVWEFTDQSFSNVLERERVQQEALSNNRAESHFSDEKYRGGQNLEDQVAQLRAELETERQLTRNFHNTYIASLHELANDVCKLDTTGNHANFCRTFNDEYKKMQSRGEQSLYRGVRNREDDEEEYEDEEEDFAQHDSENSLSDLEDFNGQSDYF